MTILSRYVGKMLAGAEARKAWQRYGLAFILPLVALALTQAVTDFPFAPFFTIFSLSVVIAAMFGGIKPGLVAVASSIVLNLLALPPAFSLRVQNPENLVRVAAFAIAATCIAILIGSAGEIQDRLNVERERLDVTLRSIGDAVIATDERGRVTFMNRIAEIATGHTQQEAQGRPLQQILNIVNEQTRARVENPVDKVIASGRIVGLANHTILIRKDGSEIPIDDSAAPILNKGQLTGVVLVFRDITESKLSEAALLRAEKLASVGRLAATIAHEINNPLESVTNLVYLMSSTPDIEAVKKLAEAAQNELARAAHVTRQTLSFARNTGSREAADLAALVDSIIGLYRDRLASRNIELVKKYRGKSLTIASRSEVRQVISNLLANAIDAEKRGGRIDIRVYPCPHSNLVSLVVGDRGCGIQPEQMRKIFEPFFTTKKDVGTGLGLWVTKQIVDSHGGTIRVRSRIGCGTVFRVNWPMHDAAPVSEAATAQG